MILKLESFVMRFCLCIFNYMNIKVFCMNFMCSIGEILLVIVAC